MNKIRIGIIGCGKAGKLLGMALKEIDQAELAATVAQHEENARKICQELGAKKWYADYRTMLKDKEIDAVFIAAPDKFHTEMTIAAARAGKHILCEKPLCRTLNEADLMIKETEKSGVKFMVGFTERFNQAFVSAKKLIDKGHIGQVRMIWAKRGHPKSMLRGRSWLTDQETGGVLNYVGTHNIDLVLWFMDSPLKKVYAEMGNLTLPGKSFTDSVVLTMRFENDGMASLVESFGFPSKLPHGVDRGMEILGTKGMISIDMMKQPVVLCNEEGLRYQDLLTWPKTEKGIGGALREEVHHFIECVLTDKKPLVSGEEGRRVLEVCIAAKKAYESGEVVKL